MRILVVAPRLPWPPTDGGRVAMSRLAESLARCGAEVEVLSLNPRKHRSAAAGPLPIHAIDIDTSRKFRPLFSTLPYIVARFVSHEFRDALRATLRRFAPDVVQIESPFLLPYASTVTNARVVLRSLNVEFRIWESLARIERRPLRRFALRRIASSLRKYELRAMQTLDAIIPISHADAADFRLLGITPPMHVVPCGATVGSPGEPKPNTVGFIGALDYLPNRDAVRWINEALWPRVVREVPNARLSIARDVDDASAFMRAQSVMIS